MRSFVVLIFALVLIPIAAQAEIKTVPLPPTAHRPTHVAAVVDQAAPAPRSRAVRFEREASTLAAAAAS